MSRILLIGPTGGVGHRLVPLLLAAGHRVSGLHRRPGQEKILGAMGIDPILGDLMEMTAEDMARAARGHDVIVFSAGAAGSGADRTTEIDGEGPIKFVAAAKANGIKRMYLVSAFPEAGRSRHPKPGFEHYMHMKKKADVAVAESDLDWVILRPGTLTDEDGDGKVTLGPALPYGEVARGNVAAVLAGLIDTPAIRREILELTDGDTPVELAVKRNIRR